MTSNIREFELSVKRETEEALDRFTQFKAQVAADGASGVIEKTPVDTGNLVNSWTVNAGSVSLGAGAVGGGSGPSLSASEADQLRQAKASSAAGAARVAARASDLIEIVNGAEYAVYVEQGTSRVAPRGMVSTTITELRSKYDRVT
jgi:uncharacterized protein CbrC (UPF0167 family)